MNHILDPYMAGSTEPWTVSVIQALIELYEPKRILELGTFEGLTTEAILEVAGDAEVWTVDIEDRRLYRGPGANFVEEDAITFLSRPETANAFDFVFVDDDHTREHVEQELGLLIGRVMRPGGLIVMHDVIGPFNLADLVAEHGGIIIDLPLLHAAGGLGIIRV